jgi:hypothetical protein
MSISFAWPICFRPDGNYSVFINMVCSGRQFRQPLALPDASKFVDGLELWMKAASEAASLFACFDGVLSFQQTTSSPTVALLILYPSKKVIEQLRKLNLLEPLPTAFIYFNVDLQAVKAALIDLISTKYREAIGKPESLWHPVLDPIIYKRNKSGLKAILDKTSDSDRPGVIEQRINEFFSSDFVGPKRFPVLAGDRLGTPSTAFGEAKPPVGCPLITDPKHFIFKIEERCGRVRNPLYDLWTWLNHPLIKFLAPSKSTTGALHPILQVTGLNPATLTKPSPRLLLPALPRDEYTLPIQNLADFFYRDNARIEWRLNENSLLETRLRPSQPSSTPDLVIPKRIKDLTDEMWRTYAKDIVDMSLRFQVPCELIMAFLGKETSNLNVRAVRFEPVVKKSQKDLDREILNDSRYEELATRYIDAIGEKGKSSNVPDPLDISEKIFSSNTLTWGEMAELIDLSPYFKTRLSPGLMQTLISTIDGNIAFVWNKEKKEYEKKTVPGTLDWVKQIYESDLSKTYPPVRSDSNIWEYFGVAPKPTKPSDYLINWLIVPRQSIFVGAAYIRKLYNSDPKGTCWDPARQAAAYNAGSVRDPCGLKDAKTTEEKDNKRTWGMCYYADYMSRFGQVYNAAVELLNTPGLTPVPSVRLRK